MSDEKQISLDDILSQAIDAPAPDAVEPPAAPADISAEPQETAEAKAQRERDERGRFKAKTDEIATPAAPEAPVEPVASTEEPKQDAQPEKPKPVVSEGHFRGWSPEQRAKFDALPPEAQETVLALKRDTDAHYTRKLEEAAQTKKQLEPVAHLLNQTADIFAAQGMDPVQAIQGYANIERTLTFGTLDQKLELLGQIAKQYGIPFAPQQQIEQYDPNEFERFRLLHDRDAEKLQLQRQLDSQKRELENFQRQQLSQQVEAFSRATNPDGTPRHPLFETVKGHMGALLASQKARTLDEAYALAVEPIQKALEEREAKARADAERARQEAVERAKKAAPVKTSSASPSGRTVAPKGIDAVLNSALDQMGL
jgi:hypothetical protein